MKTKDDIKRSLRALHQQGGSLEMFIDAIADSLILHYEQHRENRELYRDLIQH